MLISIFGIVMTFEKIVLKLMCFSRNTFYVWKREKRPIIKLLNKYFTDIELEEFVLTGKINKQELVKDLSIEDLESISSLKQELIKKEIELHKQRLEELEIKLV